MNEKQAKLLRYFVKYTRDQALAKSIQKSWPTMSHRAKGRVSAWLKRVVVTMMHIADQKKLYEAKQKAAREAQNLEILKGFVNA